MNVIRFGESFFDIVYDLVPIGGFHHPDTRVDIVNVGMSNWHKYQSIPKNRSKLKGAGAGH